MRLSLSDIGRKLNPPIEEGRVYLVLRLMKLFDRSPVTDGGFQTRLKHWITDEGKKFGGVVVGDTMYWNNNIVPVVQEWYNNFKGVR